MAISSAPRAGVGRDFLDLDAVDPFELKSILSHAHRMKKMPLAFRPMEGKTLALIFEKPSTRTRVSFEVGIRQLGGSVTTLSGAEIQLGRGETIADTGRVADGATVPVINGLTDYSHPCQIMADLMTVQERLGTVEGKTVVWSGDGDNNVLTSWIQAAPIFDFTLRVLAPPEFTVPQDILVAAQKKKARVSVTADPDAIHGADVVVTDCWVSMHNSDAAARQDHLEPYRVDSHFMRKAAPDAIFMHCLPAHRGEEVSNDVLDGPQSVVWDEAENRLHVQKAIMCWCLGFTPPG